MLADAGPSLKKLVTVISYFTLRATASSTYPPPDVREEDPEALHMMMIILGEGVKKLFFLAPLCSPEIFVMVRDACPCREDYDESWGKRRM
jgi:hypothetical protein